MQSKLSYKEKKLLREEYEEKAQITQDKVHEYELQGEKEKKDQIRVKFEYLLSYPQKISNDFIIQNIARLVHLPFVIKLTTGIFQLENCCELTEKLCFTFIIFTLLIDQLTLD